MTIQELYEKIGGSYESAKKILPTDKMLGKFVQKFLTDKSCEKLMTAAAADDAASETEDPKWIKTKGSAKATYTEKNGIRDVHHETGYFKKVDGNWMYSVGSVKPMTVVREGAKIGRNDPCPCGSGKKYKHCHGA